MQIKTCDLTGAALDWAVAKCEGVSVQIRMVGPVTKETPVVYRTAVGSNGRVYADSSYRPSQDWETGGPIIEREEIDLKVSVVAYRVHENEWEAGAVFQDLEFHYYTGPTPLIAAMRCYVASNLGDTVEVPDTFA